MAVMLRVRMGALSENKRVLTAGILALVVLDTMVHAIIRAWSLPSGFMTAPLLAGEAVMCVLMLVLRLCAKARDEKLDEIREAKALTGAIRGGVNW